MTYAPLQKKPSPESTSAKVAGQRAEPRQPAGWQRAKPAAPALAHAGQRVSPLPLALRSGLEQLSGVDLSEVQVHHDSHAPASLGAAAFTYGKAIHLGPGEQRYLPHEGWHAVQQAQGRVAPSFQLGGVAINNANTLEREADTMGALALCHGSSGPEGTAARGMPRATGCLQAAYPPVVQRAMKFELQTKNTLHRARGTQVEPLGRKYGPQDFIVQGSSGVRLESEHDEAGFVEFETSWHRSWPELEEALNEAVTMTESMSAAPKAAEFPGYNEFPFDKQSFESAPYDIAHLRKKWKRDPRYENSAGEKPLAAEERLLVKITDPTWNAGIQVSESFLLSQYESYLKQHEWSDYVEPVIASADDILSGIDTKDIADDDLVDLKNFLEIIVNYVLRGQGMEGAPPKRVAKGAFPNVKGMPAKQAFVLMNRTNFAAIYRHLRKKKKVGAAFRKIVKDGWILRKLGLTKSTRFFRYGFGSKEHRRGPTVAGWLQGIVNGEDLLAGLSAAMGKEGIEESGKHAGLVRFEARNSRGGVWETADKWLKFAADQFKTAATERPRDTGKGGTGLKLK